MKRIINADDYGWSESCTKAIVKCLEQNMITTTTMCVNGDYFAEAVMLAKENGITDKIGIHLNLTEGRPLTKTMAEDPLFCDANGRFHMGFPRYKRLNANAQRAVYEELTAQVEKYLETGLPCHHVDSHHHIHTAPFITPIVLKVMREHNLTGLRLHRNIGEISPWRLAIKNLYNRTLKSKGLAYADYFGSFEDAAGVCGVKGKTLEIMCHPDLTKEGVLVDRDGTADYDDPHGREISVCLRDLKGKESEEC